MNAKQTRTRARLFVAEVLKLLPAEYHHELTKLVIEQQRKIDVLEGQLMNRDGYVLHSIGEENV